MNKKQVKQKTLRQAELLNILESQGDRITSITNETISALLGVSKRTVERDLAELHNNQIIIKETTVLKGNYPHKQRDIILLDHDVETEEGYVKWKKDKHGWTGRWITTGLKKGKLPKYRFSLEEHRQLSQKKNHKIYTDKFGEVIWERRYDGKTWERNMPDKEFRDFNQAWHWMMTALAHHHKRYLNGDKSTPNMAVEI